MRPTALPDVTARVLRARAVLAAVIGAALLLGTAPAGAAAGLPGGLSVQAGQPVPVVGTAAPSAPSSAPVPLVTGSSVPAVPAGDPAPAAHDDDGGTTAGHLSGQGTIAVSPLAVSPLAAAAAVEPPVVPAPFAGPPEAPSRYQGQVSCDPVEKPGAVRLRALLRATYGRGTTAGITRACSVGGSSEHKEGRAYDWGLNAFDPADRAVADALLAQLVGPDAQGYPAGNARRLGLQYIIWDRQIWNASSGVWKPYTGPSPHTDHIHFSLSWDGAFARTSWWTGTTVSQVDHGPCQVYTGVLVAPYSGPNYTRCAPAVAMPRPPFGSLDSVSAGAGQVTVSGWLLDPEEEVGEVHVYVGGTGKAIGTTLVRPDVLAAHPGYSGRTPGWSTAVTAPTGVHEVCAYGIGSGPSGTVLLGCRSVTVTETGSPFGAVDVVSSAAGRVSVSGWVVDPDVLSGEVHVYVAGRGVPVRASASRPDVAAAFPAFRDHSLGWSASLAVPPGVHEACVFAVNSGPGSTVSLGCRSVVVRSGSPYGALDVVRPTAGAVEVQGWAVDPDALSADVQVSVDGRTTTVRTDRARPDVVAAFPELAPYAHGWATRVAAAPGARRVCVTVTNTGPGSSLELGCRTVSVPAA